MLLEGRTTDGFDLMFGLGAWQHDAEADFVSTGGVVCQLGDGDVVAISNLEVVLLNADHEDESVGVLETVAEPAAYEEGHPVEVNTIVEIVETCLILIYEIGGDDRGTEAEGGGTAFFFSDVDQTAGMSGELDGELGHAIEAVAGLGKVGCGETGIPLGAMDKGTGIEVEVPLAQALGTLGARHIGVTVDGVDLVGETEMIPIQALVGEASLEGGADKDILAYLETEVVDHASHTGGESTVVTLTVGHNDGADAAMEIINILVVGCRDGGEGTNQSGPLVTEVERHTGANLGASKSGVQIERVGVELGEHYVLCLDALSGNKQEGGNEEEFL